MEIFSTAYLPGIIYLRQYVLAPGPVIDMGEHYIKQTHRNRAIICSSNGPMPLIIPLRKSDSKRVGDMLISYVENWQTQHLKAIRSCYKNSPYYEHYQEEFEAILSKEYDLLHELNADLFSWILQQLDIAPKHSASSTYIEQNIIEDYRSFDYFTADSRHYKQVFSDRNGFIKGLSIIDLLFNKGPESLAYLQ